MLSIFLTTVYIERKVLRGLFFKLMPFMFTIITFVYIYLGGLWHVYLRELLPTYKILIMDEDVLRVFLVTNIAVQSIWVGSWLGSDLTLLNKQAFTHSIVPFRNIYVLILLSLSSMILAISLGSFGYIARDVNTVMETQGFSQYLNLGRELGMLAFITLVYFNIHRRRRRKYIIVTLLVFLFFGVLFGSKSASLYFIVAFIVTRLFLGYKVNLGKNFLILLISFYFVAAIIGPFRQYYVYGGADKTSVKSLSGLFSVYVSAYKVAGAEMEGTFIPRLIDRLSYIIPATKAIEYADSKDNNVPEDYRLNHIFAAPAYALVPRLIWRDKPKLFFGRWFSKEVLGWSELSSVGITPQAYVYLTGGYIQVALVFLFYGFIQRIMFNVWVVTNKAVPLYIFLYLKLGGLDDVCWAYLSGLIKMVVVYSLIYYVAKVVKMRGGRQISFN